MLLQSIAVLVSVLVRSAQYGDQYTKINQKRRKVPGFLRNQELFGGDYWTRTSDLLRVKMRRGRKERAILSFPPLLAQNDLLSAPLVPLSTTCPNSSLGHGLGQALK